MSYSASLLDRLRDDPDPEARAMAAYELAYGDNKPPGTAEALRTALTDPAAQVRDYAAEALGVLEEFSGERGSVPALLALLDDADADVRYSVIYALGVIGAPEALPALERIAATDCRTAHSQRLDEHARWAIDYIREGDGARR